MFSVVYICQSVCSRGCPHPTTTHDAIGQSQVTWGPPSMFKVVDWGPRPGPGPGPVHSPSQSPGPCQPPDMIKLVHNVAHTFISKRVVGVN